MSIDLEQFHAAFFEESFEAIDGMESALLSLDVGSPDPESINTIFRVAHSIKGGAGMFGFTDVMQFTHVLETLLDELRSNRLTVTVQLSDLLLESVDVMRAMLRAVQSKVPLDAERVASLRARLEEIGTQSRQAGPGAPSAPPPVPPAAAPSAPSAAECRWRIVFKPNAELLARGNDPIRIFGELAELGQLHVRVNAGALPPLKDVDPGRCLLAWELTLLGDASREAIDQIFEWAEGDCELSIVREGDAAADTTDTEEDEAAGEAAPSASGAAPAAGAEAAREPESVPAPEAPGERAAQPKPAAGKAPRGDSGSIRVNIEKIDELLNSVGEIVITQSMLTQLGHSLEGTEADKLRGALTQLERNVRELQESVMRVRMLPISSVFSRFPRLVRDVSQRLGKRIELKMTGEQTELDKTVLEKIGDPLVHLIRNSIDHGIEMPEVRTAAGKQAAGTVHLNAFHKGGAITIEVTDDGKGIDKDRILAKARSRGLVGPNDNLAEDQIYDLIFLPGFSTAEQTTDLSGRGVGMDVVRRNIKELGGTIELRSELGRGTRTSITLPLTLAIVDGQSVGVGEEIYIVPLTGIVESLQLEAGMASQLVGRGEVFSFRGTYLPIIRMHEVFDVQPRTTNLHEGLVMVVEGDGRKVGLFVDELLGQQQVVIKSTETNYRRIEGVAGATILGDGSVALILDVPGLIRVAAERSATSRAA